MIFNRKKVTDDEPVETQRSEMQNFIHSIPALGNPTLEDFDSLPGSHGPFGLTISNPIPVNGPIGERVYIFLLRSSTGKPFVYQRLGSFPSKEFKRHIDIFELLSSDGKEWTVLYLSMMHPRRSTLTPPGMSRVSWSKHKEPFGLIAKHGGFGLTRIRSSTFPNNLPGHVQADLLATGFPAPIARATATALGSLLGAVTIQARPYSYTGLCQQYNLAHTDDYR